MNRYCNYELYLKLLKECDPDDTFRWIREDLVSSIAEYDREMAKEVDEWIDCTSGFLKRYMKFACGCMTDHELYKFYNDILEMLDRGIEAREAQKKVVDEQLLRAEEEYANELITEEEYEDIKYSAEEIKRSLDEDIEVLKDLKSFCVKAKDKFDVVMCIEKVANTAHSRGHMLPVLCGAYLPEDIIEAVTGREEWYEYARPEDVGLWLSKDATKVFDCIKEFGREKREVNKVLSRG
jgi:hypothetical protein